MSQNKWYIGKNIAEIKKRLGDNLEEAGQFLEAAARRQVVDMGAVDTGRLRDSITHSTDRGNLTTTVGSDVEYAPYVELGTYKMAARPFLRYALYLNEQKLKEIINK